MHLPVFAEQVPVYKEYNAPLTPIANHQKKPFPNLRYTKTVYNGIDPKKFPFSARPEDYFLCITTIGEHKNTGAAVEACRKAGVKLIIAGKIRDKEYYEKKIKPFIDGKKVIYLGEIGFEEKVKLYRGARGFIFPTIWPEPFGLVAIEALACGTPVIGWKSGGVPEIVEHGKNGYLVSSVDGIVSGIRAIDQISRKDARASFEQKFTSDIMIKNYEAVAYQLVKK
jgi:glycosyltransferase involved in cell wall biosynthesis